MDVIELLKKDHQEVTRLFQRFAGRKGGRGASGIVDEVCGELEVHAKVEEEIFYPAVREADDTLAELVEESLREHARVKSQVQELRARGGAPEAADLERRVTALQRDVEHHLTEEEGEMFPRVAEVMEERQRTEIGRRLQSRKQELKGQRSRASRPVRRAARKPSTARTRRTKSALARNRARKSTKRRARGGRR